jgi:hypothetical protein
MLTLAELRRVARERFTPTILALAGLFALYTSGISAIVLALAFPLLGLPVPGVLFFVTWALVTAAAFLHTLNRLAFPREEAP